MTIAKKLYALFIALCLMVPMPAKSWNSDDVFNAGVIVAIILGCAYVVSDDTPAPQSPPQTPNSQQQAQEERDLATALAESQKTYVKEQLQKAAPSAPELHDLPTIQNLPHFDGIDVDSALSVDVKRGHTNTMRLHNSSSNQSITAKVVDNILLLRRTSGHGGPVLDQKQTVAGISIRQ
jgi:hypothetical protein